MWVGSWPSLVLVNLRDGLASARQLVERPPRDQPDEVTRALARFLVVRACGYVERVTAECLGAYAASKGDQRVGAYAKSQLSFVGNPTPDRLLKVMGSFDSVWQAELRVLLDADDEYLSREMAFLVDRRNRIAHGDSEGITAVKALALCRCAERLGEWMINTVDPR